MMAGPTVESRLTRLEQGFTQLSENLSGFVNEQREFRAEWRKTKEQEAAKAVEAAKASADQIRSSRLTVPQIVGMGASVACATAIILGGLMWMIQNETKAARNEAIAQVGQVGLQVRGLTEAMTSASTAMQILQRDIAQDRVKLGLVDQRAADSARAVQSMEGYDAHMARHDERISALNQTVRELAARLGQR